MGRNFVLVISFGTCFSPAYKDTLTTSVYTPVLGRKNGWKLHPTWYTFHSTSEDTLLKSLCIALATMRKPDTTYSLAFSRKEEEASIASNMTLVTPRQFLEDTVLKLWCNFPFLCVRQLMETLLSIYDIGDLWAVFEDPVQNLGLCPFCRPDRCFLCSCLPAFTWKEKQKKE